MHGLATGTGQRTGASVKARLRNDRHAAIAERLSGRLARERLDSWKFEPHECQAELFRSFKRFSSALAELCDFAVLAF